MSRENITANHSPKAAYDEGYQDGIRNGRAPQPDQTRAHLVGGPNNGEIVAIQGTPHTYNIVVSPDNCRITYNEWDQAVTAPTYKTGEYIRDRPVVGPHFPNNSVLYFWNGTR